MKLPVEKIMTSLISLRNGSLTSEEADSLVSVLPRLMFVEEYCGGPVCITAANLLSHQVTRGISQPSPHVRSAILSLISKAVHSLDSMHAVYIARAARAMTVLPLNEAELEILESLIAESVRPARLESFSAMDLSEVLHSFAIIVSNNKDILTRISPRTFSCFIESLLREFLQRSSFINIQLTRKNTGDRQWLSIQAVSNILFALSIIRTAIGDIVAEDIEKKIVELCNDLICNHCDKIALQSCQPKHVLSILRSQIVLNSQTTRSEEKAFRLLLAELIRKNGVSEARDRDELFDILRNLETRWSSCSSETRNIPFIVRNRILR